jgi:hypothetical protein
MQCATGKLYWHPQEQLLVLKRDKSKEYINEEHPRVAVREYTASVGKPAMKYRPFGRVVAIVQQLRTQVRAVFGAFHTHDSQGNRTSGPEFG